jgi:hypothetical protein
MFEATRVPFPPLRSCVRSKSGAPSAEQLAHLLELSKFAQITLMQRLTVAHPRTLVFIDADTALAHWMIAGRAIHTAL